jgi:predicted ribosome quality control (RQC) complex YloA/Tae2 family protein
MLTDWLLIARLGAELRERLRGARADDAGLLPDGRVGLVLRQRRALVLLAIDLFSSPPLVTIESGELGVGPEPSFTRALARSLRAMVLTGVVARRHDRLLRFTFSARSRFGVGETLDLYLELVPRFGNAILVKDGTVVAAYKEFGAGENRARTVTIGLPYELPPLPAHPRTLGRQPAQTEVPERGPLFAYRRNGRLVQAYVTPLDGFEDAEMTREDALLPVLSELHAALANAAGGERTRARRRALLRRIDERERRLRAELASIDDQRGRAQDRDGLRSQGEQIFATLHALPEGERETAKLRAAELFAQYRKLGKRLPHLQSRERSIGTALEAVEALRWEAERTADEDLDAVDAAVTQLDGRRGAAVARPPGRRRLPLELRTRLGSRILVGRSPLENADLTFRVARPGDFWFHAQRIPGAHVILSRDDRATPPEADLALAASLAAFYSRARDAATVAVDYTLRKHVRKQRAAPPGLVWYTQAKTIVARPQSLADARAQAG